MDQQLEIENQQLKRENEELEKRFQALSDELCAQIQKLNDQLTELRSHSAEQRHVIAQLNRKLFGSNGERYLPKKPKDIKAVDTPSVPIDERVVKLKKEYPYKKKSPKQEKTQPKRVPSAEKYANLPVDETIELQPADLPEGARCIGKEVTSVLKHRPATYYLCEIIRFKYVLPNGSIVIADLPDLAFPKQAAGSSVVSKILNSKYVEHLPLYRQQEQLKRAGVEVSSSTLSDWAKAGIEKIRPIYDLIGRMILQNDYLQVDETHIRVLDNERKNGSFKGYLWAIRAPKTTETYFKWDEGRRSQAVLLNMLGSYQGAIQSDGYAAYNIYDKTDGVTLLACWAHARRYFEKALEDDPENAQSALSMIQYLYRIEREADEQNLEPLQRSELREQKSFPLLKLFEQWMINIYPTVLPKSSLGKAISYTTDLWYRLGRYLLDGNYLLDNNGIENVIRPIALGRKNYLFCPNDESAERAAIIYTIIASCKQAKVDPEEYLADVMNRIDNTLITQLEQLLPRNWVKQ